jgi:hypothetical protein
VGTATGSAALPLYQKFWMYPAAFAVVILLFFVALFRDDSKDAPIDDANGEPRGFEVKVADADASSAQSGAAR